MFLERFYPDERSRTACEIDYEGWRNAGKKAVLFDIDNTLVPHGAPADARAISLFARLRGLGFSTCLISNNDPPRVEPFAGAVGSDYICNAAKPSRSGYRRAMDLLRVSPEETLFVGDQIFTDIWGARRAGIHSILVDPIHPKEEIQIVLKRRLEWPILRFYERSRRSKKQLEKGSEIR